MATLYCQISKGLRAGLLDLPSEVLEHILNQGSIDATDVVNTMQTCTKLRDVCQSNEVWRQKLYLRWPDLADSYDRQSKLNWYDEYRQRVRFGLSVRQLVGGLSPKFYSRLEVSKEGFTDISSLLTAREHASDFVISELLELVQDGGQEKDLTLKYYAEKTLRHLQHTVLTEHVKTFLSQPPEQQSLEEGAILLAQWCQPTENISANEISDNLDRLAEEVRRELLQMYPSHPMANTEVIEQELHSNMWSCEQCDQVLRALNSILFNRHKFFGNQENYYNHMNSYIDKVLKTKTGIPISLCIMYQSVARRLGVVCEPVNFPMHFLLRWKQRPLGSKDQMYTYIDVFNGGMFLQEDQLADTFKVPVIKDMKSATSLEVISRMIRNLVSVGRQQGRMGDSWLCLRNALEIAMLVTPDDYDLRLLLGRVNLHLDIDLEEVVDSLQQVVDQEQFRMEPVASLIVAARAQIEANKEEANASQTNPKTRKKPKDALFSVGLIMKHKRYHYMCVIYGWDKKCEASEEWIRQMGVHKLPHQDKQPFYNVLCEDGTNRYAAEENLEFAKSPQPITHPEVGKYFRFYKGSYYVPNAEKAREYPEDIEFTESLVRKQWPEKQNL